MKFGILLCLVFSYFISLLQCKIQDIKELNSNDLSIPMNEVAAQLYEDKEEIISYNSLNPYLPFQKVQGGYLENIPIMPRTPVNVTHFLIIKNQLVYFDQTCKSLFKAELTTNEERSDKNFKLCTINEDSNKENLLTGLVHIKNTDKLLLSTKNGNLYQCSLSNNKSQLLRSNLGKIKGLVYNDSKKEVYFSSGYYYIYKLNYNDQKNEVNSLNVVNNIKKSINIKDDNNKILQLLHNCNSNEVYFVLNNDNTIYKLNLNSNSINKVNTKFIKIDSIVFNNKQLKQLLVLGKSAKFNYADFELINV
ncbi:hypothetical protein K502DRAFT_76312 [Neoconidiobolus thromboides FSU 785]|nr:hypothetical protein K502DRAFT_76312 [Neoconidiobolus thromboides FSU 785]